MAAASVVCPMAGTAVPGQSGLLKPAAPCSKALEMTSVGCAISMSGFLLQKIRQNVKITCIF